MTSPFSKSIVVGMPSWSTQLPTAGNFSIVGVGGLTSIPEIGFGEGGFGEDGFDAPAVIIPGSSAPNWTVVANR